MKISREEALKAVDDIFNYCEEIDNSLPENERSGYKMLPDIHKIRKYIIENTRPRGEWVKTDNRWGAGKWRCTHCDNYSDVATKFCPNCGAEMIQKTCGNCYWFSKVTVPCCDKDNELTTENEKACDGWEEGDTNE